MKFNFFSCKLCTEKDARIADLKSQLKDLRALSMPPANSHVVPMVHMEADAVFSGKEEVMEMSEEEMLEAEAIQAEAQAILSGTY